ncbi:tetratricopeptide repeat-containing glycosyltransferase family 2 protein [Cohnella lupini]|uniref:Glycosyl transferase family 2 n=1 Tax=Cohnella lupini TaxID=1294267 RepID=A0A3D9IW94_9BACL|nr:glycosyltransferase family 2 protein [Cohnella lupini]RED65944.1 glycosyl transferase family 2 [Cohnella lupini]
MITISLCMIVKNEEHSIGRCLDSIHDLVDEINIVDTGSTDQTKSIVSLYTDRIFDFEWIEDFSAARNFSFEQATKDYIMWLDADDYLFENDRQALQKLKHSMKPEFHAVLMDYVLSRDQTGSAQNMTRRHRLLKRDCHFRWIYPIHEYIPVQGPVKISDIEISHSPFLEKKDRSRNIRILRQAILRDGGQLSRRYHFYLANELIGNGQIDEAIATFESFLAGETQYFEDHIAACGTLSNFYHERNQPDKELQYLLKTFEYTKPRPDYCCRIGIWFEEHKAYDKAVFWYELAIQVKSGDEYSLGLINKVCWTWGPHAQLAICFGKLGELDKAYEHNEIALTYLPDEPNLLKNKAQLDAARASL